MKRSWFVKGVLSMVLLGVVIGPVHAEEAAQYKQSDFLSPSDLVIDIDAGEEFSLDLFFVSAFGADYEVLHGFFTESEDGTKQFLKEQIETFSVEPRAFTLAAGGQQSFVFQGTIPEDVRDQDLYYAVRVRRQHKSAELFSYELASQLFFRVGEVVVQEAQVEFGGLVMVEGEPGVLERVDLSGVNTGGRLFEISPHLLFLDKNGDVLLDLVSPSRRFQGGRVRSIAFQYFAEGDVDIPADYQQAVIQLVAENGRELFRETIDLASVSRVKAFQRAESPYEAELQLRTGQFFAWTEWVGHFLLILIGLSLVVFSFYPRKKG